MMQSAPPPLPDTLVQVRDLNRVFDNVHAVRDVSFDISRGQVVGFIGANGAGKTTTMRMMATLDLPSSGTIRVCSTLLTLFSATYQKGAETAYRPAQVEGLK